MTDAFIAAIKTFYCLCVTKSASSAPRNFILVTLTPTLALNTSARRKEIHSAMLHVSLVTSEADIAALHLNKMKQFSLFQQKPYTA